MTDQVGRIGREMDEAVETVVRRIELRLMQVLPSVTPVQFGFARSGWTPSTGSPVTTFPVRPSDDGAVKAIAKRKSAENRAQAVLLANTYKLSMGPLYITNPVPYVVFLNLGSSSQAPKNFIERGIAQSIRSVGRAA